MTNATASARTRSNKGATVKSDIPAQSDNPVIEDILDNPVVTDESDKVDEADETVIPTISDELAAIVAFADKADATVEPGQFVTNYNTSTGNEAFATFARASVVEAANRTFGATVASGMFPRIDDKPGTEGQTISKGQVSNLSGPIRAFKAMGLSVSSVPTVWSRLSGSSGWRDALNKDEIKAAIRTIAATEDEADKVRILLATPIPAKKDKVVDTTTELVKAAQTLADLAEAYGSVKPGETRTILDGLLNAVRVSLAIPATIGVHPPTA